MSTPADNLARMRGWPGAVLSGCVLVLSGCHSRYVQATVTNASSDALQVVQVEYPSASFGTQELKPGESFHYRFKLLGSGPVKVIFTDAHRTEHQQTGPILHEGEEGRLEIRFPAQDHAEFQVSVQTQ